MYYGKTRVDLHGENENYPNLYRPQQSWAKVMFLQASVILSTGGCLPQCMLEYTTPEQTHPPEQTPPRADTPWEQTPPRSRHPREQTPPPPRADTFPREQTPPHPREADSCIRSTSGRYASYWNAFLLTIFLNLRHFARFLLLNFILSTRQFFCSASAFSSSF